MGWILTSSGRKFDPMADKPDIALQDIVFGLARKCRYSGQLRTGVTHYSVAEHAAILTIYAARNLNVPKRELRALLMHDAAEAYVGDVPRPIKKLLPEFTELENRIMRSIAGKYDFPWPPPPWVHDLDERVLTDESHALLAPGWRGGRQRLNMPIGCLSAPEAASLFLRLARTTEVPGAAEVPDMIDMNAWTPQKVDLAIAEARSIIRQAELPHLTFSMRFLEDGASVQAERDGHVTSDTMIMPWENLADGVRYYIGDLRQMNGKPREVGSEHG